MNNNTGSVVARLVSEQGGVEESAVRPDSKLVADIGLDSLDIIELAMAVEDEFEIVIPDDAMDKFSTVQDVINAVDAQKGGGE